MSLPDDIIETILRKRDVYVLNYHEPNFDMSRWKCLGVYNAQEAAKRAAVRIGLESIDSFNLYDPAKRFYERTIPYTAEKTWVDRWQHTIGMCIYTVETRRLDSEGSPSETLYFNFDAFFKRYIIEHDLRPSEARALLVSWKLDPPYEILLSLFSAEEEMFKELRRDREEWTAKYGSVGHYPYGEYDPL